MARFIGRKEELKGLRGLLDKKTASLVIIKGRRRIGKSRLAEEFACLFEKCYSFSGLPPTKGITREHQLEEFVRVLQKYRIPFRKSNDWGNLFDDLAGHCKRGRILVVLDEISWLSFGDPTFLGKLKTVWDTNFKKNSKLIMILSGSQSTWIEKNILSSSGFVGRISYQLTLEELSLGEANQFWYPKEKHISPYEKLKLLSVTGGIPRYLEEIQPTISSEENIKNLCFQPEGFLFNEFDQIFSDLFAKRSKKYKMLVTMLAQKSATLEDLTKMLNRKKGGDISNYLDDLCKTGFVTRDFTWDIKKEGPSKLSIYRLSDNYIRFYLKYINPNKMKIFSGASGLLPASWQSIIGIQFENLVLAKKNRRLLYDELGIHLEEIIWSNPYFQTKTRQRRGCQIDLLIQTKFNTIYIIEIKFSREKIEKNIIEQIQRKIDNLILPRNYSVRPVLIHVNGVHESVIESEFFSHIIDFSSFLASPSQ